MDHTRGFGEQDSLFWAYGGDLLRVTGMCAALTAGLYLLTVGGTVVTFLVADWWADRKRI